MTTSNAAAAAVTSEKTAADKAHEKLAEKRRALGRGLESLLPGPRVVPATPTLPQTARKDEAREGRCQGPRQQGKLSHRAGE